MNVRPMAAIHIIANLRYKLIEKRFRHFIIASAILTVSVELILWFYEPAEAEFLELWSLDSYASIIQPSLPIYVLFLFAKLLILVGLYNFNFTARTLFLFYLLFVSIATFVWGWRVTPPIYARSDPWS